MVPEPKDVFASVDKAITDCFDLNRGGWKKGKGPADLQRACRLALYVSARFLTLACLHITFANIRRDQYLGKRIHELFNVLPALLSDKADFSQAKPNELQCLMTRFLMAQHWQNKEDNLRDLLASCGDYVGNETCDCKKNNVLIPHAGLNDHLNGCVTIREGSLVKGRVDVAMGMKAPDALRRGTGSQAKYLHFSQLALTMELKELQSSKTKDSHINAVAQAICEPKGSMHLR